MIYFSLLKWILLLIFISCLNPSLQSNDASFNNCLTQLADACFKNFSLSLDCSTESNTECDEPEKICKLFNDSLKCSAGIIYGDCSKCSTCVDKFNPWFNGLLAMKDKMCNPINSNETQEIPLRFFQNTNCWDRKKFIKCIDEKLDIQHVVHMLNRSYSFNDCNYTISVMVDCNSHSVSTLNAQCIGSLQNHQQFFIEELLYLFFAESMCTDTLDNKFSGIGYFTLSKYVFILTIAIMIWNYSK